MSEHNLSPELIERLDRATEVTEKALMLAMNGEEEQAVEEAAGAVERLLMDPEVAETVLGGGVS